MTDLFASVNNRRVVKARAKIPASGIWIVDLDLDTTEDIGGPSATIILGGLTLKGTFAPVRSGTFGEARKVRVVGGANGWSKEATPKHFRNDAGIKRSTILQDAALLAGETLVIQDGGDERVGVNFIRRSMDLAGNSIPISSVFGQVAPTLTWWVDTSGVTQLAKVRPTVEVSATKSLEVLEYDARHKVATLAGDFDAVTIGTVLRSRVDQPLTVRELLYLIDKDASRILAWGST